MEKAAQKKPHYSLRNYQCVLLTDAIPNGLKTGSKIASKIIKN